jgi:serine/threonine protein phosphatase PrpC
VTGQGLSLIAAGGTHEGLVRDQNEDRWCADAARGVFCVVDGVGGHPGGEHASEIAVEMLRARLARETGTPVERLREAITLANNAILDAAAADTSLAGMTCVLTAALVGNGRLTIGHVGDTRLYKLRAGRIVKLTQDHSPVGEREDAGELTEAEAMRHPRRNEVYRDVGAQPHAPDDDEFVDIVEAPFEPDAAIVICSDGLSDQVSSAAIRRSVEAHAGQPSAAVEELIRTANDEGGKDNVTVVVVEGEAFAGSARGAHQDSESAGSNGGAGRSGAFTRRWWTSPWLMVPLGFLLGLLAAGVALHVRRPDVLQPPPAVAPDATDEGPRTWRVGLTDNADAASITEALGRARAGDTLALDPGDYREAVVVRVPIRIEGPQAAVLQPPLGATPGWTAVEITGASGVQLRGITIAGAAGQPLSKGVRVENGDVDLDDVRITGALDAAVDIGPGGRVALRASVLADNPGAAIVARAGARLELRHCLVLRNGSALGRSRPAIDLAAGATAVIVGNAIGDSTGPAVGGPAADLPALIRSNVIRPAPRRPPSSPPPGARPGATPSPR